MPKIAVSVSHLVAIGVSASLIIELSGSFEMETVGMLTRVIQQVSGSQDEALGLLPALSAHSVLGVSHCCRKEIWFRYKQSLKSPFKKAFHIDSKSVRL